MATVTGPLGAKFGNDPFTFVNNMVRAEKSAFVSLTQRCSNRTGLKTWTTSPVNGKAFSSRMAASGSDDVTHVALMLCLWAIKAPSVLMEEARNMAMGLPMGAKSLDGNPAWNQFAYSGGRGEEPISLGLILTLGVTILVGLAPIVLPMLISAVGGVVSAVQSAVSGKPAASGAAPSGAAPAPTDAPGTLFGIPDEYLMLAGAAVLLLAFWKG